MADVLVISVSRLASQGVFAAGGTQGRLGFRAAKGGKLVSADYSVADRGPGLRQMRIQFVHDGTPVDTTLELQSDRESDSWWFVCPYRPQGSRCGRQVAKLYLPPRSPTFGCRHCYGFTYGHLPRESDDDLM